jgi:membrane protein
MADDAMGLAQQIAYSSLLAFFPAMAFVVGALGLFHVFLIVVGGKLGEAISKKARLSGAFDWTWGILRWPVAFAAILLFFAFVYYLGPNRDQRNWKWVTPGSIVGAILWLVLSGLFAVYVAFAGHYTKTYGSIASGVILLLWLNYSAFALLYGAELNSELARQADIKAAGGEHAGLVRPATRRR